MKYNKKNQEQSVAEEKPEQPEPYASKDSGKNITRYWKTSYKRMSIIITYTDNS